MVQWRDGRAHSNTRSSASPEPGGNRAVAVEYEASGLSQAAFCGQKGLSLATLARYRKRRAPLPAASASRWLAVEVAGGGRDRTPGEQRLGGVLPGGGGSKSGAGSMPGRWSSWCACWSGSEHVRLGPATRIYLAAGATDMRKGFEGLYGMARDRLSAIR